jgi:hypothetical protein
MKQFSNLFLGALLLILGANTAFAQRNCSAMDVLMQNLQQDAAVEQRMRDIESHTQEYLRSNNPETRAVVRIPVVVHVLYRTSTENISDAQIQSQITVLNKDFRRTNTDRTTQWSQAADSEIEFCLATRDPNGNATTGITRTATTVTSFSTNDAMKYSNQGGKSAWPTDKYLNIWVCNLGGGILGYAQFPGGGYYATDGVVIGHNYFGTTGTATAPFNKGRTATHEVGHWLNLRHIWGDGPCGTDDFVSDTPESDAANYGCATGHVSCGSVDMVQNYMDYSDDACMNLFTLGQKNRMQALFATGGFRVGLLSSQGCSSSGGGTTPTYCASNASNTSYEWISNVNIGTINNTSTASTGGYGNYTNLSTNLAKGSTATIRLTPTYASSTYTEYFKVYIDYNNDKDFDDAGENVYTSAGVTAAVTGTFTIPSTALTGTTRMRIVMSDATIAGPCTTFNYGEVEDYSVNITTSTTTSCNAPTSLTLGTVTSSGALLSWTAVSGASNYTLQIKSSASTTWTSYTVSGNSFSVSGLSASTTYNWQVRTNCSTSSSAYVAGQNFTTLAATTSCSDNYESNNSFSAAKTIRVNTNITARIGTSTDIDWFKFSNSSTSRNIRVTLTNLPFDYDIYLYNSSGTLLYRSENGSTTSETITYNSAPVGTYYIRVIGYNGAFSSSACYTLRATTSSTALREAEQETVVTPKEETTQFEDISGLFDFNLYPNPAKNTLNIQLNTEEPIIKAQAFDVTGRVIWSGNLEKGINSISVEELPAGMYHFSVISPNGERLSKTFVKTN